MRAATRWALFAGSLVAASSCTMSMDEGEPIEVGASSAPLATPCGPTVIAELRETATAPTPNNPGKQKVWLNCSVTMDSSWVISKRIILEGSDASGATIDCNGARIDGAVVPALSETNKNEDMITIMSQKNAELGPDGLPRWNRPTDITIKNCRINGSVRIIGMGKNGENLDLRRSSRTAGHVAAARNAAPTRIKLENVTITGRARVPLYFAPGVTYSSLVDSEINGSSSEGGIYLDAESSRNVIRNNKIHPNTTRDLIAIDASDNNQIINNWFSALEDGGIYLYRNCGQGGTSRHTTPSYNTIVNNIFYYNEYQGGNPSVYLGSRNGDRDYCDDDDDSAYGSGISDLDFARYNVVMQNQIYKRSLSMSIRQGESTDSPNYIGHNTTVTTAVSRLAGCHVLNGYFTDLIPHGGVAEVFRSSTNGAPVCTGIRYTCNDGVRTTSTTTTCSVSKVDMGCQRSDNNAGCQTTAYCPSGRRIIGAVGACNLESGTIDATTVSQIPVGLLRVVRASDVVSDGRCWAGYSMLSSGETPLVYPIGASSMSLGCYERDSNGGDCHIRGSLYCQ